MKSSALRSLRRADTVRVGVQRAESVASWPGTHIDTSELEYHELPEPWVLVPTEPRDRGLAAVPVWAGFSDDFVDAPLFSIATAGSLTGSNVGATWEGEFDRPLGETSSPILSATSSVWARFVAPAHGTVTLDTLGSSFDTHIGVYTGVALAALTTIIENDDNPEWYFPDGNPAQYRSLAVFDVEAAVTYLVVVGGYGGESGDIVLNYSFAAL